MMVEFCHFLLKLIEGLVLNLIGSILMAGPLVAIPLLLFVLPLIVALPAAYYGLEAYAYTFVIAQAAWGFLVNYFLTRKR